MLNILRKQLMLKNIESKKQKVKSNKSKVKVKVNLLDFGFLLTCG